MKNEYKIAIVAVKSLGDGLLFMIIAYNLVRNGYHVDLYSDIMSQIQTWQPNFSIYPFPQDNKIAFGGYDLVIADGNYKYAKEIIAGAPLQHVMFISSSRFDKGNVHDLIKPLTQQIAEKEKLQKLLVLAHANGTIMGHLCKKESIAECIRIFCEKKLQLRNANINNGLTVPAGVTPRKYSKRVIIHPVSGKQEKNWYLRKFIKLAHKLQKNGWQPVFVATAAERKKLGNKVPQQLWSPIFPTIDELAKFICESAYAIANDSGVGHLASNLEVPVVTIAPSRKPHFKWRPGWGNNVVINPWYALRLGKKYFWQPFVSVNRVYKAFKKLTAKCKN